MNTVTISAKNLRLHLKDILLQAAEGDSFTVIYNSKPVAEITPINIAKQEIVKKAKQDSQENDFMKTLYAFVGTGRATDVTTPDKDKEVLRKRLIAKHVK